ncbi:hypothetical protein LOAG_15641 [Loa loa]|uniref:Uncharacterized protein n=1 Tax=Loa loa TaxID=7209 RepID=A0A1S0TFE9_LOALO|nr:hypothetical protein LOAG_15641 [Loa loa]EFO12891.1 hypothetical protein LOAG_15641 [Loa loa]
MIHKQPNANDNNEALKQFKIINVKYECKVHSMDKISVIHYLPYNDGTNS